MLEKRGDALARLGFVHIMRADSLKMTCKVHKGCVVWMTLRHHSQEQGIADLCAWLASAAESGENLDDAAHHARGVALKRAYGMRVR